MTITATCLPATGRRLLKTVTKSTTRRTGQLFCGQTRAVQLTKLDAKNRSRLRPLAPPLNHNIQNELNHGKYLTMIPIFSCRSPLHFHTNLVSQYFDIKFIYRSFVSTFEFGVTRMPLWLPWHYIKHNWAMTYSDRFQIETKRILIDYRIAMLSSV